MAGALAVVLVVALTGLAAPGARASLLTEGTRDIVKSSNGALLSRSWRDAYQYYDPTGGYRYAWNTGSRSVTYGVYELLSRGDVSYDYYYIQARLDSSSSRMDYPYRATPAELRIGANGTGIKVVSHSWTKGTTIGKTCSSINLDLAAGIGIVSLSAGAATWKLCGGGVTITPTTTTITSTSTSSAVRWKLSNLNYLDSAEFDYVVKVRAGYKPNFRVDLWTPYDYTDSTGRVVETYDATGFDTGTNCRVGSSGCPAG